MKKINLALGLLMLFGFSACVEANFTDVSDTDANADAIYYVEQEGIVTGYPDKTYKPNNKITREEFVTIIARTLYSKDQIDGCTDPFFPDVARDQWFSGPICIMYNNGLIKGYSTGEFGISRDIQFVEAAKILSIAWGQPESTIEPWFKEYVDWLASRNAIPTSIQSFEHFITRGEMAEMIYRLDADIRGLGSMSYELLAGEVDDGLAEAIVDEIQNNSSVDYIVEPYVTNLEIPWDIAFTSPTRMLVTERPGRLRVVENGVLQNEPLHTFSVSATSGGEEGLMAVELDPDYDQNKWIYLSYAYNENGNLLLRVVRFTDQGDQLSDEITIIDGILAAKFHAGSDVKFGPDGKLYITTGDAIDRDLAQDLSSLAGKVLRLNKDGSIPTDNPFGDEIWSYGHRNSQGIDWHPDTGEMYSSEHGPSGFDGPGGGDEVNRIVKGGNYGWPLVSHENNQDGLIAPIALYTPAEAPGSLIIYKSDVLPQFTGSLFVGALKGQGLIRLELDGLDNVVLSEKIPETQQYGRIRNVTEGPDGFIYFTTSNRDGRGSPVAEDDRILRIRPE